MQIYLPRYLDILNGLVMLKVCTLHVSTCKIFYKMVYIMYVRSGQNVMTNTGQDCNMDVV